LKNASIFGSFGHCLAACMPAVQRIHDMVLRYFPFPRRRRARLCAISAYCPEAAPNAAARSDKKESRRNRRLSVVVMVFRVTLRYVHRSSGVMGRGVNRIQLDRNLADVGEVVPPSRGNEDRAPGAHVGCEVRNVPGSAHGHQSASLFDADELVGVRVNLKANVSPDGYAHDGQLQMLARPEGGAEIGVLKGGVLNVQYGGAGAVVLKSAHGILLSRSLFNIFRTAKRVKPCVWTAFRPAPWLKCIKDAKVRPAADCFITALLKKLKTPPVSGRSSNGQASLLAKAKALKQKLPKVRAVDHGVCLLVGLPDGKYIVSQ